MQRVALGKVHLRVLLLVQMLILACYTSYGGEIACLPCSAFGMIEQRYNEIAYGYTHVTVLSTHHGMHRDWLRVGCLFILYCARSSIANDVIVPDSDDRSCICGVVAVS